MPRNTLLAALLLSPLRAKKTWPERAKSLPRGLWGRPSACGGLSGRPSRRAESPPQLKELPHLALLLCGTSARNVQIRGGNAMTLHIAMLLAAAASLAAAGDNSWDNLQRLRAGEKIEVIDARMKRHSGEFLSVTEEGISLAAEGGETRIERANVARVSLREHSKRLRNVLIGTAAGGAAGAAAMAIWARRAQPTAGFRNEYYDIGKYIFLPAGLGAGAAIGAAAPRFETIYRARPAVP